MVTWLKNRYALSILDKIVTIIMGALASIFYVRYLGLEYKGIYSYVNEIASIVAIIANLGIYQSYPYFFRKEGHTIYNRYVNFFVLQFLIYALLTIFLCCLLKWSGTIILAIIQIPILVFKNQMDNVFLVERIKAYMLINMINKTALCVFFILLWLFVPTSLTTIVLGAIAINSITCIIYLVLSDYNISFDIFRIDIHYLKSILKFGFFPMLSSLLLSLNYSLDIILLKQIGTAQELSIYSLAAVLINYVWIIPNAFKEVVISDIARRDNDSVVSFSVKLSNIITMFVFFVFVFVGRTVIVLFFGQDFSKCYGVTLLLFMGTFSMIFFKMIGPVFVTEGRQLTYFFILLASVASNTIANYLLIPIIGMYGAALASVISYDLCGILFLIMYCQWKKKKIKSYIFLSKEDFVYLLNIIKQHIKVKI